MVLTVIQLVALSVAGQHVRANETSHTLWSLDSRGENQQPPTQDMIFSPQGFIWISFQACNVCHSEQWRRSVQGGGLGLMINGNFSSYYCHNDFKFNILLMSAHIVSGAKNEV